MTHKLVVPFEHISDLATEREAVAAFILEKALEGAELEFTLSPFDDEWMARFHAGGETFITKGEGRCHSGIGHTTQTAIRHALRGWLT